EPAEAFGGLSDGVANAGFVGDVTWDGDRGNAGPPDALRRLLGFLLRFEVGDGHVGAGAGHGESDRLAETARAAGDEHRSAGQIAHSNILREQRAALPLRLVPHYGLLRP